MNDAQLKALGRITTARAKLDEAITLILNGADRDVIFNLIDEGERFACRAAEGVRYDYGWNEDD
jgi:hypothetical protein